MVSKEEVARFLNEFKVKMKAFQIQFRDERKKNTQTLLSLEMTPGARKKVIENLEVEDYCEGPINDKLYGVVGTWVFGKSITKNEIYIKISMGRQDSSVLCVSFHDAEHKMSHPFKKV
jgi:hypothetical protein